MDYIEGEQDDNERDLDKWIEENLSQNQHEISHHMDEQEEIVRRNKKELDIENDIER